MFFLYRQAGMPQQNEEMVRALDGISETLAAMLAARGV